MSSGGVRVGFGFDSHRLDGHPPLLLGGVEISTAIGVSATSDGDVVAHAVSDALLGAAVLGDLGDHFPSDDPAWRNADSMGLLGQVVALAADAGWKPSHVDVTVVAESVRVAPHREAMRDSLAATLGVDMADISVKATSTDGMGFIGSGEGLAAIATVTAVPTP